VHRIGRTGRAGRSGEAILFVTPREKGMLRAIERATRQPIEEMKLPSVEAVNDKRVARFLGRITDALAVEGSELDQYRDLVLRYQREHDVPLGDVAAALVKLLQGKTPLLLAPEKPRAMERPQFERPERGERRPSAERPQFDRGDRGERPARAPRKDVGPRSAPDAGMETYRIEVGHRHGVKPGNIVGAIANEADLESKYIGRIDIHDDFSLLDLPAGMPPELMSHLKKVRVAGQPLRLSRLSEGEGGGGTLPPHNPRPHRKGPPPRR
jgi:ATP-dependent RNA helicase DeaD